MGTLEEKGGTDMRPKRSKHEKHQAENRQAMAHSKQMEDCTLESKIWSHNS